MQIGVFFLGEEEDARTGDKEVEDDNGEGGIDDGAGGGPTDTFTAPEGGEAAVTRNDGDCSTVSDAFGESDDEVAFVDEAEVAEGARGDVEERVGGDHP